MAETFTCGDDNAVRFMDQTQDERFAEDVFDVRFASCMDLTFKELDDHFKTYADLTAAQRQIRVRPGARKNIKAFVQWTRDEIRLGRNPGNTAFPIDQVSDLIRRYKTHEKFQIDSKTRKQLDQRSSNRRQNGRIGSLHF
jgi:hypothetical protein